MPAHPGRSAFAEPGTSSEVWSPATLPVWRAGDENRAPDTLVEATFSAIADAGSIPAVSTGSDEPTITGRAGKSRSFERDLLRRGDIVRSQASPRFPGARVASARSRCASSASASTPCSGRWCRALAGTRCLRGSGTRGDEQLAGGLEAARRLVPRELSLDLAPRLLALGFAQPREHLVQGPE